MGNNESKWTSYQSGPLGDYYCHFLFGWILTPISRFWAWIVILILMAVFAVVVGLGVTGRVSGLLIDTRNMISRSRFQMTAWTIVVLSIPRRCPPRSRLMNIFIMVAITKPPRRL